MKREQLTNVTTEAQTTSPASQTVDERCAQLSAEAFTIASRWWSILRQCDRVTLAEIADRIIALRTQEVQS